jgi:hypothetical protein
MQLAHKVGKVRQSGNKEELDKAIKEHEAYKDICLKFDVMTLDVTYNDLR